MNPSAAGERGTQDSTLGVHIPAPSGPPRVEDTAGEALRRAERHERDGEPVLAAVNYAAAAIVAARADRVAESLETAVRAVVAYGSVPRTGRDRRDEARLARMLGVLCHHFADHERAVRFHQLATDTLATVGDALRWSAAARDLAESLLLHSRRSAPDLRRELLERAEQVARQLIGYGVPDQSRDLDGPWLLAWVLCERGRHREAWELLGPALGAATEVFGGDRGPMRLTAGRCLLRLGRPEAALAQLDAALAELDHRRDPDRQQRVLQLRSRVREELGDLGGALADARRAGDLAGRRQHLQAGGVMDQVWSRAGVESQRRDLEARARDLRRSAEQDPLTGLANRRAIEAFCAALPRHEEVCLMLVDVDNFKQVNDRHGHGVGDEVLREVARLLSRSVRAVDRVARWGGEEFLIAVPGRSRGLGADAATRVRQRVERYEWRRVAPGLRLTVSVGVTTGPAGDVAGLLHRADGALYAAKRAGRNRVVCA